jgi:hypothetical protein
MITLLHITRVIAKKRNKYIAVTLSPTGVKTFFYSKIISILLISIYPVI